MDIHIDVDKDTHIQTYGGIVSDSNYEDEDFGLQFSELTISGFSSDQFAELGMEIINHLILNGYKFKLVDKPHQDMVQELKEA